MFTAAEAKAVAIVNLAFGSVLVLIEEHVGVPDLLHRKSEKQ